MEDMKPYPNWNLVYFTYQRLAIMAEYTPEYIPAQSPIPASHSALRLPLTAATTTTAVTTFIRSLAFAFVCVFFFFSSDPRLVKL